MYGTTFLVSPVRVRLGCSATGGPSRNGTTALQGCFFVLCVGGIHEASRSRGLNFFSWVLSVPFFGPSQVGCKFSCVPFVLPCLAPLPSQAEFHGWLTGNMESGNITRQEAVSMLPPLFLDVHPKHLVSLISLVHMSGQKSLGRHTVLTHIASTRPCSSHLPMLHSSSNTYGSDWRRYAIIASALT